MVEDNNGLCRGCKRRCQWRWVHGKIADILKSVKYYAVEFGLDLGNVHAGRHKHDENNEFKEHNDWLTNDLFDEGFNSDDDDDLENREERYHQVMLRNTRILYDVLIEMRIFDPIHPEKTDPEDMMYAVEHGEPFFGFAIEDRELIGQLLHYTIEQGLFQAWLSPDMITKFRMGLARSHAPTVEHMFSKSGPKRRIKHRFGRHEPHPITLPEESLREPDPLPESPRDVDQPEILWSDDENDTNRDEDANGSESKRQKKENDHDSNNQSGSHSGTNRSQSDSNRKHSNKNKNKNIKRSRKSSRRKRTRRGPHRTMAMGTPYTVTDKVLERPQSKRSQSPPRRSALHRSNTDQRLMMLSASMPHLRPMQHRQQQRRAPPLTVQQQLAQARGDPHSSGSSNSHKGTDSMLFTRPKTLTEAGMRVRLPDVLNKLAERNKLQQQQQQQQQQQVSKGASDKQNNKKAKNRGRGKRKAPKRTGAMVRLRRSKHHQLKAIAVPANAPDHLLQSPLAKPVIKW
eukprot:TRINITY_DN66633_c7_g7_i1.p1 TRINITY_DN66633_c7_g7~~TRINITY_DN66633_c7_g7_i1.p1  ORF type:complete len:554 (-),score=217.75 TRINITY_DN66633_c7_g7_i1:57-1598(-)